MAKFVLNIAADTIRLPDTRGMYAEATGFNGLSVGDVHEDAIRNITGAVNPERSGHGMYVSGPQNFHGAFYSINVGGHADGHLSGGWSFGFDASLVVPTSVANMPRAYGVLGCVYVGRPLSQKE